MYHLFENFAPRPVYTRYTCGWSWIRIMSNGAVETHTGTVAHISDVDCGRRVEEVLGSTEMALPLAVARLGEPDTARAYHKAFEEYLLQLAKVIALAVIPRYK